MTATPARMGVQMDQPTNDRLEELFDAVRRCEPSEQTAFLGKACGDDDGLKARVRSLLRAHGELGEFLAEPAPGSLDGGIGPLGEGQRIGHYTVRRVIATGGMGVVYEAMQEQPHRTVALKVMRRGIASRSALRRFEYESQILARLRHPNIAQVYEAGTHDDGGGVVPYFAMEYIPNAKSLIDYANERKLNTRERLELFTKVCQAVHHGHLKGVIHRDLKPGNILVDSGGEPKIIDFGVARATDSDMALTTLQTGLGQLIGTLQYMSPEQCEADPHDLDSRSDVYALGVVMYELLCGQFPYDLSHVAVPEAARMIRDEPPAKPSAINRTLRGDVETITLKALEKDRARRYQTAADLASDVRHYLRDEPIVARPASTFYQVRKFARRNKALVGGVVGMMALLVVGTALVTWQAVRARAESSKAVAFKEFLTGMLGLTESLEASRRLTLEDVLDRAVDQLEEQLAGQPIVEADVRHLIGRSYAWLSKLEKSHEQVELAWEIRRDALGPEHPSTLEAAHSLGETLRLEYRWDQAEEIFRWVVDARGRSLGEKHPDTLWTMTWLADVLRSQAEFDESEATAARAREGLTQALGEEHYHTLWARLTLAETYRKAGKLGEAEAEARELYPTCRGALGDDHWVTLEGARTLGLTLDGFGRWGEAKPLLRVYLEGARRLWGTDDHFTLMWIEYFGWRLHRNGETEEGEQLLREGVDGLRRVLGRRDLHTAYATLRLARVERDLGNYTKAKDLFREAIDVQRESLGEGHSHPLANMATLARWLAQGDHEDLDEAESLWRERLDIQRRVLDDDDPHTLRSMHDLAWFLKDRGPQGLAEAESLARDATDACRTLLGDDDEQTLMTADTLAVVLHLRGKNQDAILEFEQVAAAARKTAGEDRWFTLMSPVYYGRCLLELDRYEDAETVLQTTYAGFRDLNGEDQHSTQSALAALIDLYEAWGQPEKAAEWRAKVLDDASPGEEGG